MDNFGTNAWKEETKNSTKSKYNWKSLDFTKINIYLYIHTHIWKKKENPDNIRGRMWLITDIFLTKYKTNKTYKFNLSSDELRVRDIMFIFMIPQCEFNSMEFIWMSSDTIEKLL